MEKMRTYSPNFLSNFSSVIYILLTHICFAVETQAIKQDKKEKYKKNFSTENLLMNLSNCKWSIQWVCVHIYWLHILHTTDNTT